jgi:Dna[CI] antecedent, DciA
MRDSRSFDNPGYEPVDDEPPVPVREGLERFFRFLGSPPVDVVTKLETCWAEVVGPALAGPTAPVELRDGTLVVLCDDPAWAAQVSWMEAQIKQRFATVFPAVELRRVVARTRR